MGYYADFLSRPKQAMAYAKEHPSALRALTFVLLGTFAGLVVSLVLTGVIYWTFLFESLVIDLVRWLVAGILLVLAGMVIARGTFSRDSFVRALSMLAHVNVYGFFLFLIGGLLLPIVVIPDIVSAAPLLENGVIGEAEFEAIILSSLSNLENLSPLFFPLILICLLFLAYAIYAYFLAVYQFLNTTVFKALVVMGVIILVQSFGLFLVS